MQTKIVSDIEVHEDIIAEEVVAVAESEAQLDHNIVAETEN